MHGYHRSPLAALAVLMGACAAEDAESVLGRLVEDTEVAAESRDTSFFRDVIAPAYQDTHGNDRDRVIGLIRGYFLANRSIDVAARIERVELSGDAAAELTVLAGILGRRAGAGLVEGLDGRLYRLELELVRRRDGWRVIGADWERALDVGRGE